MDTLVDAQAPEVNEETPVPGTKRPHEEGDEECGAAAKQRRVDGTEDNADCAGDGCSANGEACGEADGNTEANAEDAPSDAATGAPTEPAGADEHGDNPAAAAVDGTDSGDAPPGAGATSAETAAATPLLSATPAMAGQDTDTAKIMNIAKDDVGSVIGKGGETIKRIQMHTGARIQIERLENTSAEATERQVSIFGTEPQRNIAAQMIQDAITIAHSTRAPIETAASAEGSETVVMQVPSTKVGVVIGRAGDTIKNLQLRSGARIQVTPDSQAAPGATTRDVTICGPPNAIQTAKQLINEVVEKAADEPSLNAPHQQQQHYQQHQQPRMDGPKASQVILVPNDQVGLLIGKQGATIKELQAHTGCHVQIAKAENMMPGQLHREVTLEGSMGAVEECKRQIQDRLASRGVQIQVGPMNGGGGMGGMGGPGSYGGYQQPPQGYAQPQYGYPGAGGAYYNAYAQWQQPAAQQQQQQPAQGGGGQQGYGAASAAHQQAMNEYYQQLAQWQQQQAQHQQQQQQAGQAGQQGGQAAAAAGQDYAQYYAQMQQQQQQYGQQSGQQPQQQGYYNQ
eukprot:Rmarinus@m.29986